ncbi:MAG: alpha/beta hydrolase domain-containing protein [Betaproteobacteria bacterium]
MPSTSPTSTTRWSRRIALIAVAALVAAGGPAVAANATTRTLTPHRSHITSVTVTQNTPLGTFNGATYVRVVGTLDGVVASNERIVGLDTQPKDADGNLHYSAQFELITTAPGERRHSDGVVVEAENRGNPFVFDALQGFTGLLTGAPATIKYPDGLGNGFLQNAGLSWARVQWQGPNGATTVNPTVPATAQGVGEVIVRDFGLLLRGLDGSIAQRSGLNTFRHALLVGVSQSAWFVDTFIAEGFNAARPAGLFPTRVFDAAYAQDGVGNWLGINQTNAAQGFATQTSYVEPNGVPLTPAQLLHRPLTDPFLIDTTAFTDFFRVRASIWNSSRLPGNLREFNFPVAHTPGTVVPAGITVQQLGCDIGGTPIPALNPSDSRPFARAAILSLARLVGIDGLRSPAPLVARNTQFRRTAAPAPPDLDQNNPALPLFNFLPGVTLTVPVVNADSMPVGDVVFPDAALPLGTPLPVSVPPVATRSITDTCGNFGGWRPFTAAQLRARYGSVDDYVAAYAKILDRVIAGGYVLKADRAGILTDVQARYNAAS